MNLVVLELRFNLFNTVTKFTLSPLNWRAGLLNKSYGVALDLGPFTFEFIDSLKVMELLLEEVEKDEKWGRHE